MELLLLDIEWSREQGYAKGEGRPGFLFAGYQWAVTTVVTVYEGGKTWTRTDAKLKGLAPHE